VGGAVQDDAVDVGAWVALVGEAGLDELAQKLEKGLDAAEGFGPQADLGRAGQGMAAPSRRRLTRKTAS
jgi:hypothetical protein